MQVPGVIPCFIFQQVNPPTNYDVQRFGPWEPVNVLLVPEIPSKHKGAQEYKVVIMYVPTSQPLLHNWMGYRQPSTARIKAVCCGPSKANCCPIGARTVAPCAHSASCLLAGCIISADPTKYNSTHKEVNLMDPGTRLPT